MIDEYSKIAFCNICDFYTETDGELKARPLEQMPKEATAAIASLKGGKDGLEIKLYDKFKALEAISSLLSGSDNKQEKQITIEHSIPRRDNENKD